MSILKSDKNISETRKKKEIRESKEENYKLLIFSI
jgi:hypothetical protein